MHRKTVIHLPFPPSNNRLYGARSGHGKGRYKLANYTVWLDKAGAALSEQFPVRFMAPHHSGLVNMIYVFKRPDKRVRDLSNYLKGTDDFLVQSNLIADDSLIHGLTAFWSENVYYRDFQCARPSEAGVTVTIEDVA